MGVAISALLFAAGLTILCLGAHWLVAGASGLAIRFRVRPLVIGLTVVAFGTSAPELAASLAAAFQGSPDIAIGNVIGSNIANVGLIVGLTALILPIAVNRSLLVVEVPFMFAAMALFYGLSRDGELSRGDGAIMFSGLILFIFLAYFTARRRGRAHEPSIKSGRSLWLELVLTVVGLVGLTLGARLMVAAAIEIAVQAGISELVIGITIVAIGTSLPELAASLAAVIKKEPDLGLGNVIGSNIFNICFILGVTPMVRPLAVGVDLRGIEFQLMVAFSIALAAMLAPRKSRITRPEGVILLTGFIAFLAWSFYYA